MHTKAPQFEIQELGPGDAGEIRARLSGRLDMQSALHLGDWLDEQIAAGARKVELDLEALDFANSTGIGCLVAATCQLRDDGGDLVLERPGQTIRDSIELLDLRDFLTIRI